MNFSITVLPGDGIGPEVVAEAVKVMNAVGSRFGHSFDTAYGRVGGNAIDDFGTPLPDETVEMCAETDGILFGAVGGPQVGRPARSDAPGGRHSRHSQEFGAVRQPAPGQGVSAADKLQPHQAAPA